MVKFRSPGKIRGRMAEVFCEAEDEVEVARGLSENGSKKQSLQIRKGEDIMNCRSVERACRQSLQYASPTFFATDLLVPRHVRD